MDPKDTTEPLDDDHPRSPAAGEDVTASATGEDVSASPRITIFRKGSTKKEGSPSNEDGTDGNEDSINKSKSRFDQRKSPGEISSSGENPSPSKVQDALSGTQTSYGSRKKQTFRLHKKHYSISLPFHPITEKKVARPIKKKAPVIIRNISAISVKENDLDDVTDSEHEAKDNSSIRLGESSHSKTIIISQSPNREETHESRQQQSTIDSRSEGTITDEGSVSSKSKINIVPQNDSTKKKDSVTPSASSSQASPYNTRYAHMKIGPVFSVSNRSSGISRRKLDKDSKVFSANSSKHDASRVRYEKSSVEDVVNDNGVCFLCGISFANDMGISLSVKKPLPLSNIDLVSLLESFSISCASVRTQNLNYVNICNVCHTLVIEGDSSYKHLLSVASEMREQWPYRALKKNPVFSLNIPESSVDQLSNLENVAERVKSSERQDSGNSEVRKVRGRVGRPPKIKQEDDRDINWKPSQVKLEGAPHAARRGRPPKRKIKREKRGRPRKVVIKGEITDDEVYTCGLCSETFLDENDWGSHYESMHKTQLRWVNYRSQKKLKKLILMNIQESFLNEEFTEITCHACDNKFFEKNSFVEHLRCVHKMVIDDDFITALYNFSQGHENVEGLSDSDVEKEMNTSSDGTVIKIEKEMLHTPEKPEKYVKCKVCHLNLSSEKALKDHTDTNHFSLVVIANDDTKEVVLPEEKSNYQKQKGNEEETSNLSEVTDKENLDIEYVCEDCEEAFDSRHDLLEHKLNIHGSNDDKGQERGLVRYECEVCGRRIYGLAALKVHMTKVHYKTASSFKFSCGMCVYKSQSRSQLGKHMRCKHGKEIMPSVQCETCGKMYGSSYIAKHIATMHSTHTRNYSCNFCDMKFYDMAGLKFHIYHEHANKVWKCNKCPMEFKKYHQLRQHRIFTHSTKVHACMECPKTYKRKSDLTEHVKRLHLQRVVLLCPRCPKQYVNRFKLRNHLMKYHDVPWEDTLARNYARHQRANNCRRTEDGVLEASKDDEQHGEESSIFIQESYDHFNRQKDVQEGSDSYEGQVEEHEYQDHFNRHNEEHEYHAHYRQSSEGHLPQHHNRTQPLASVKMERDDPPEEYIEIMEATDAFAKDGITYVIIEET